MKQDWNEPDGGLLPEAELNGAAGEEEAYADESAYEDVQEQYAYEPEETGEEYVPDAASPYVAAENPGFSSEWLGEDQYDEEEEQLPKHTIFKPRTRKPSFILAVAVNSFRTLILLALTLFSRTIMNLTLPEVATHVVAEGEVSPKIRGQGTAEVDNPYSVTVAQSRTIQSVAVRAGQTVKRGDVIYHLEDTESEDLIETLARKLKPKYKQYPTRTIRGRVLSATTGQPIAGTIVSADDVEGYSTLTEENGFYKLDVPTFTTSVYINMPDFNPASRCASL